MATIDVNTLVNRMKWEIQALPDIKCYTISRVPAYIRQANKEMHVPMVIAIGPYHHRTEHLQAAEEHKCRYLRSLLSRTTITEEEKSELLSDLFRRMKALEEEARKCYSESIDFESDKFVKMMLLDGCFIIEFSLNYHCKGRTCDNMGWGLQYVEMDLRLSENQIPFLVIRELFDLVACYVNISPKDVIKLVRPICHMNSCLKEVSNRAPSTPNEIHHLLHLYYRGVVPATEVEPPRHNGLPSENSNIVQLRVNEVSESSSTTSSRNKAIPSVTELCQAGVRFRKKSSPSHALDITFKNGIMEIPFIQIDDYTIPTLINIIAFEQSVLNYPKNITDLSAVMDMLINTEKDVAILEKCGIIENLLGSDEEVALFFNQLCKYAEWSDVRYFNELFKEVNCYYESRWHNYIAELMHKHCSNPWKIISLLAAIVLLVLTALQVFYAILPYYKPRK